MTPSERAESCGHVVPTEYLRYDWLKPDQGIGVCIRPVDELGHHPHEDVIGLKWGGDAINGEFLWLLTEDEFMQVLKPYLTVWPLVEVED